MAYNCYNKLLGINSPACGVSFRRAFHCNRQPIQLDFHHAAQFFPFLEARQEQIIMVPNNGQNILSEVCLKEALLVHQTIVNISGYGEICFRQLHPSTQQKPSKHGCIISSPLELAGAQFENLKKLPSILASELPNSTFILSTDKPSIIRSGKCWVIFWFNLITEIH